MKCDICKKEADTLSIKYKPEIVVEKKNGDKVSVPEEIFEKSVITQIMKHQKVDLKTAKKRLMMALLQQPQLILEILQTEIKDAVGWEIPSYFVCKDCVGGKK